ncbi:MAG: hypothetical protein HQL17_06345 [Candidatus Omnitrophica bacterium]|nr:hypothetical protein [Candidatus Omnitrophota bacterium]
MGGWNQIVIVPLTNMLNTVAVYLPFLFGAMIILLIGWIIAKTIASVVQQVLERLKFNELSAQIGLTDILNKGGLSLSPAALLSSFVYWVLFIVVLATTMQAIGLEVAAKLLERVMGYVPNVVSAVFVVVVGMFLANLVTGIVKAAANNAKLARAELLASIAKGGILIFTAVSALEQLNIATFFVTTTFQIFFAAVCLALALAFGIGGKDLAARILWDFYNQQNEKK